MGVLAEGAEYLADAAAIAVSLLARKADPAPGHFTRVKRG